MENLELYNLKDTEVSALDFEGMKTYLENALVSYRNNVYTKENLAAAKEDKAELNKVKKMIEDKRKEYKAKCLAPYEAVEYKFKELVDIIEDQRIKIDAAVKEIDAKSKLDRESALRKYYDSKSASLGNYADRMYKRIFADRWFKESYSMKKCEEEIIVSISASVNDLEKFKQLRSPFLDEIIEFYLNGGSFEACIAKNEELAKAAEKAGAVVNGGASKTVVVHEIEDKANSADGITVRIKGSKLQLEQVFDFMKIMGVDFEVL